MCHFSRRGRPTPTTDRRNYNPRQSLGYPVEETLAGAPVTWVSGNIALVVEVPDVSPGPILDIGVECSSNGGPVSSLVRALDPGRYHVCVSGTQAGDSEE